MTETWPTSLGSATGTFPNSLGEAAQALKELSEPWEMGDRIKAAIGRAAHRAGLSYSRAFDLWYGKARRIEEFERAAIAEALEQKRDQEVRNELHELRIRLARLESRLAQKDTPGVWAPLRAARSVD